MERKLNEMIAVLENQNDAINLINQRLEWIFKEIQESRVDKSSRIESLLESILDKLDD
jgi:hypothetical protein